MNAIVLGVDIGSTGAVSIVTHDGVLIGAVDMPVLNDGPAGRPAVNAPLLSDIIARSHATMAYVEYVAARPGEGPTGAFAFGRCKGVIEGVCAALGLPVAFLTPPAWKRAVGIAPGKDRAMDHGRAEACLIAIAGMIRERQGRR